MRNTILNTISTEHELKEIIQRTPSDTVVIFDFDQTLFLSNSTEEYLNSIKPRWLNKEAFLHFKSAFLVFKKHGFCF